MKRFILRLVAVVTTCSLAATAIANPQIERVIGTLDSSELVTIVGSGFGADGPQIILYDDFNDTNPGQEIPLDSPQVGKWSSSKNSPKAVLPSRSGNGSSFLIYDGSLDVSRRFQAEFGNQREIFFSYWVRIPPGTRFTGRDGGIKRFSTDSSWKMAWLMDGAEGYKSNDDLYDVCLPTFIGNRFDVHGNSYVPGSGRAIGNDWWSWDEWIRIAVTVKDPNTNPIDNISFDMTSASKGSIAYTIPALDNKIAFNKHQYDRINFPGWIRESGGESVQPQYDDIYISIGPGAEARVEFANAPVYENATVIELTLAKEWSEGQIEVEVPRSVSLDGEDWYVFVTNANGERNTLGIAVANCDCPKPPTLFAQR